MIVKSRIKEARRPKAICSACSVFKTIKAYGNCQSCWHTYKRRNQPEFYLRQKWSEIKQRCSNINKNEHTTRNYLGRNYCSLEEFLSKFNKDPIYLKIFNEWRSYNFAIKYSPSIDRIDNKKDYIITNLQFLTHSQNSSKDQDVTPVNVYKYKTNEFIGYFSSQMEASRILKIPQSNLWKVLNKERNSVCGYRAEYA